MNYFPNGDEEIALIKYIAKYQYLKTSDLKYFFSSKKYYRKRITSLIEKKYLRRIKQSLVLGRLGIEYVKQFNYEYTPLNRNKKYFSRLLYISGLGASVYNSKLVKFTPSFLIKDKEAFTTIARRYIGILNINGIEYLTYHISEEHDNKYVTSTIYDIQKERKHKNIIIFIDNINRINIDDFAFGLNRVLIIEDTECNREMLKYIQNVRWSQIIEKYYENKVYLSEYNFYDYTNYKNKYVSTFYFLDSEKINRIRQFLRENKNKNADIICSSNIHEQLIKLLPNVNYIVINLEEYIDKERHYYE